MDAGMIGGIAGGVIGLLGGVIGTYFSIRNTSGPRERAFMVRAAAFGWVALLAFLTGVWLISPPYRPLLFIPFFAILLPVAIRVGNRRQEEIRREEAGDGLDGSGTSPK